MTKHPCAGRSKKAIEAFERIAINQEPNAPYQTIQALLRAGLIVQIGSREVGRDVYGLIKLPVYEVPIPIHYQWCKWASEQPDLEESLDE